jgi:hypothetical protein
MSVYLKEASPGKLAGLGFVLSVVPLYFVTAAVLNYGFGVGALFGPLERFFADPARLRILNRVITPVLFFGGPVVALALNVYAVRRRKRNDAASPRAAKGGRGWNVAVAVLSGLLLMTIATYGFLENFTSR